MKKFVLVLLVGMLVLSVFPTSVSAAKGVIASLYPPSNDDGRGHGAGTIIEDGTNKLYVFQTPQDVTLCEGDAVTFNVLHGRVATDVQLDDNPI